MGWAIAIWAIGVITAPYCSRSNIGSTVRDAPKQSDIPPSTDSDDNHIGTKKTRKPFPFETIYVAKPQRLFHTHACSACRGWHINDVEDMTELKCVKFAKTALGMIIHLVSDALIRHRPWVRKIQGYRPQSLIVFGLTLSFSPKIRHREFRLVFSPVTVWDMYYKRV